MVENKGYIGLHEPVIQALDLLWLPCCRLERVSAEENMGGEFILGLVSGAKCSVPFFPAKHSKHNCKVPGNKKGNLVYSVITRAIGSNRD